MLRSAKPWANNEGIMRVTLVNTAPESFAQKWDKPGFPPLGLGYVAASLRRAGVAVDILDAKLEELELSVAADRLAKSEADIFGLTAMTHEVTDAAKLAARIKDAHPKATTIIGGCHAIALPVKTLTEFDAFDVARSGEGEETICEIVRKLSDGRSLAGVRGAVYR